MKAEIVNKKDVNIELNESLWKIEFQADVVAQAVNIYMSNQRKGSSKAKRRGEVDGGGIKPWKQKGTGRARHGSIRSPIWVGGGATFAPTGLQNFSRKVNKKANVLALGMVFSKQLAENSIRFVDFDTIVKGTEIRNIVEETVNTGKKLLVISDDRKVTLALRNMENVEVLNTQNINVFSISRVQNIVLDKSTVENIEKILTI